MNLLVFVVFLLLAPKNSLKSAFLQGLSYDLPGVSSSNPGNQPTTGGNQVSLAGWNFGTNAYSGANRVSGNLQASSNVNGGKLTNPLGIKTRASVRF